MTDSPILAATVSLALALSGCAGAANPTTGTTPSVRPAGAASPGSTTAPTRPTPPSAAPAASAGMHGESRFGGTVSVNYQTLAQFIRDNASFYAGIAVVTVESVGPLRWNTPDGSRPAEAALHAGWDSGTADSFIGRAYRLRLERVAWGKWTATGPTDIYWLAGGKLGADETGSSASDLVPPPVVGGTALALTGSFDFGTGVSTTIATLFPVDAGGRVITLDPTEDITLADLDRHLP